MNAPLKLRNADVLRHAYIELELSAADIANMARCSSTNVFYWLKVHGIERRSCGAAGWPKQTATVAERRDFLEEQYVHQGRTLMDIAAELGVSYQRVGQMLKTFGIQARPRGWANARRKR